MSSVPRRENGRPTFQRRSGVISSAEIEAAVKASGIPDDSATTGPMGIRDNESLRKNAAELLRDQKKRK
jgi:hypothetical protein